MNSSNKIDISKSISKYLALRDSARDFFDYLNNLDKDELTIDFKYVNTVSRSFAQEYLIRKKAMSKQINEINVPDNVRKMFHVVESNKQKISISGIKTITL